MKNGFLFCAATASAIISTWPAPAAAQRSGTGRELGYFLPRTRAIAQVNQVIRRCPTAEEPNPVIVTVPGIDDRLGADPAGFIRVDTRSGFLSGRTTSLGLRPNGTLTSFNASNQGEGGEALSAVLGIATTVASFGFGVPAMPLAAPDMREMGGPPRVLRPPPFRCTAEVEERVARRAEVERALADLRLQVTQGNLPSAAEQVLADLTAERDLLVAQLTLSTDAVLVPRSSDFRTDEEMAKVLAPIDYTPWFGENGEGLRTALQRLGVPGRYGFRASLTPNAGVLAVLARGDGSVDPGANPTPYLYYRRPVPATVTLAPCASAPTGDDCTPDETSFGQAATVQKSVLIPQLSGLFSIEIGHGRLFGSSKAAATFDEQGAPLTLEYGATVGGPEIAGVIDSANTSITTLRDARTAAINREVEYRQALEDLREKLDAAGGDQ